MMLPDPSLLQANPDALIDFSKFDDAQMRLVVTQAREEVERRAQLAAMPEMIQKTLMASHLAHAEPGAPWEQPTHALNAYPYGWLVTHNGKTWMSIAANGNVHEPGVSGWREQVPEGEAPPEWSQPAGAHDAYAIGERVTWEGEVWFCTRDGNAYPPPEGWAMENPPEPEPDPGTGEMPWEVGMTYSPPERVAYESIVYECRQQHTAQAGWEPPNVPALWIAA